MFSWRQRAWFRYLARSKQPILVGPFRTEVGFESLYWLPFLTWLRHEYQIPKERLIALSRGGAGVWYDAADAIELFDYVPVSTVRQSMLMDAQASGSVKQTGVSEWERILTRLVLKDKGIRDAHRLHPSLMYRAFEGWFGGSTSANDALRYLSFAPVPTEAPPLTLALPEKFVAVGFYARHTWPITPHLKEWVQDLVDGLRKIIPVVIINSGLHTDEHIPFPIKGENLITLEKYVTPQTNLAVQSAVLAKSQAFVGTYGGLMQLAVRMKKPSLGFYTTFEGTCYAHKQLTEWLAVKQDTPCYIGQPQGAKAVQELLQVAYVPQLPNRSSSNRSAA